MALIRTQPVPDVWALWARALWRSAVACLIIVMAVGALALFAPGNSSSQGDLSQDFESTMLAAANQDSADYNW